MAALKSMGILAVRGALLKRQRSAWVKWHVVAVKEQFKQGSAIMKKMPCLFRRVFHKDRSFTLLRDVTPGCEWVLAGEGTASRKWDGTACMVKDGVLHKRYDAKGGKTPPANGIPCDEPDPVTGHWPHWVPVDATNPADKWHISAFEEALARFDFEDGTYELVGPHFNGNPEHYDYDVFRRHGDQSFAAPRHFDGLREFLSHNHIEGVVFAHPDGRMCKIRRNDFGFAWGSKESKR